MQLIHGDCLVEMNKIADKSVDLILTDPPYGTTSCKWDSVIPFDKMWEHLNRIIKDNGAIVLFGSEPFSSYLRMSNIRQYKYDWVWNKKLAGNVFLAKSQPMKIHENIIVFNSSKERYYPIKTDVDKVRKYKDKYGGGETFGKKGTGEKVHTTNGKFPKSIIDISNANRKGGLHPTQKPVALLEYLIKTYTLEKETVLDFTMGSGSTGVACLNTKRNFIGIEKDDMYFEVAKKRIEERINIGYRELEDIKSQLTLF
jgi:site-specific DNA-methyltransferase (adenine-specific)